MCPMVLISSAGYLECKGFFRRNKLLFFVTTTGGVRRLVDKEFDRNIASTVVSLSAARYAAVKEELERSLSLLTVRPSSNKQAIRAIFDAAETLFRLTFPRSPRLTAGEAKTQLEPLCKLYAKEDRTATSAAQKMLAAFMDWIDAAHWYRHAQGIEEPIEPPLGSGLITSS